MSKVITSPVKRWPGTVTLSDPLSYPQVFAFQNALDISKELGGGASVDQFHYALLPGCCKCVEKWDLVGLPDVLTPDTFPATPRKSAAELVSWLIGEIVLLYQEAEEIPNE